MSGKRNHVRKLREAQLMSKAELARKAGLSPLTIDRVEAGKPSRMDTRRKIILALGYRLSERHKVFPEEGEESVGLQEQLAFREQGEDAARDADAPQEAEEANMPRGRPPPRRRRTDSPSAVDPGDDGGTNTGHADSESPGDEGSR